MSEFENRIFLGGWICLWRRIANSTLWLDEKFTKGQAWIDLLLLAQGVYSSEVRDGQYREFHPGIVYWPISDLAKRWKWNRRTVAAFLQTLEQADMVDVSSQPRQGTVIRIRNWAQYQERGQRECTWENGTFPKKVHMGNGRKPEKSAQKEFEATQGVEAEIQGGSAQMTAQMSAQMTAQMSAHNITIYNNNKTKKNNIPPSEACSESSRLALLGGESADSSGKTKADIPEPWRNDFDSYEAYWRWRNQ